VGAAGRLGWSLGPVRLELEAAVSSPITGYRVGTSDITVVPFRGVGAGLAGGLMVPFP
jgi:hypothetical protein